MEIILILHSLVRWLIVAVGLVAIIAYAAQWLTTTTFGRGRQLMTAFTGLMDLQFLLGLIFLIWNGMAGAGFPRYRLEHATTMIIAVIILHVVSARWRTAAASVRARNYLFGIVISLILVYLGVVVLPQGWRL